MTTLIIATRNAHKVEEIRGILGAEFQFHTLRDFPNAPAVIEDADTFAGNSTKKAVELARWLSVQPATFNLQPATPHYCTGGGDVCFQLFTRPFSKTTSAAV